MKVICIDGVKPGDKAIYSSTKEFAFPEDVIIEGDIYTAFEIVMVKGYTAYRLIEKPFKTIYRVERFAPLSQISETTFERNYNTQTV